MSCHNCNEKFTILPVFEDMAPVTIAVFLFEQQILEMMTWKQGRMTRQENEKKRDRFTPVFRFIVVETFFRFLTNTKSIWSLVDKATLEFRN